MVSHLLFHVLLSLELTLMLIGCRLLEAMPVVHVSQKWTLLYRRHQIVVLLAQSRRILPLSLDSRERTSLMP